METTIYCLHFCVGLSKKPIEWLTIGYCWSISRCKVSLTTWTSVKKTTYRQMAHQDWLWSGPGSLWRCPFWQAHLPNGSTSNQGRTTWKSFPGGSFLKWSFSHFSGWRTILGVLLATEVDVQHLDTHFWLWSNLGAEHRDAPDHLFSDHSVLNHCKSNPLWSIWLWPYSTFYYSSLMAEHSG